MVHDFAVTKNWIVVPVFPLTSSMERAMSGLPPFAWEPDKGTHIAFIPRKGTVADVKWVTAPASYVFHPMNHFETADGRIVVDVMKYDIAPLFPLPEARPRPRSAAGAPVPLDLRFRGKANTFKEEQLDDRAGEFPRFDERFCMSDYRHGWIVAGNVADAGHEPRTRRAHPLRPQERQERRLDGQSRKTGSASRCSCRAPRRRPKATAGC